MMFNSSNADLKHFFNATKSLASACYVAKRLASHLKELALYRRGVQVTSGNALAARLASRRSISAFRSTPIPREGTDRRARDACAAPSSGGNRGEMRITARRASCSRAAASRMTSRGSAGVSASARGGEHVSPVPRGNTGDGAGWPSAPAAACRSAIRAGRVDARVARAAEGWQLRRVPASARPLQAGHHRRDAQRAALHQRINSYHDVGAAMIAPAGASETGDVAGLRSGDDPQVRPRLREAGAVAARVAPSQRLSGEGPARSPNSRADAGIDAAGLEATVREYNAGGAKRGRAFGRGATRSTAISAIRAQAESLRRAGRQRPVLRAEGRDGRPRNLRRHRTRRRSGPGAGRDGSAIARLYAVGNDRASIMGGNYPGAGITLGPIMTFGYITGRHLAA